MRTLLTALTLALAVPCSALAAKSQDPIAVMPFKNLNSDPALDWLKAGIAETMVSDLRKGGQVKVVERAQIDRAMTEIALQGSTGTEEATASKLGKMLGARTVVVGGFQKAGKDLRITARFVAVETGEVHDTAKVTGPLTNVFSLQDQITTALVGQPIAPKRKTSKSTVEAYRLYSLSLTAQGAEKVAYLKQAVAADKEFAYAAEELAALEKSVDAFRDAAKKKDEDAAAARAADEAQASERKRTELAMLTGTPEEKAEKAIELLDLLDEERRWNTVIKESARIRDLSLPNSREGENPAEYASWREFVANREMKRFDLTLRAGERHLKDFPEGKHTREIADEMKRLIELRRHRAEESLKADEEIAHKLAFAKQNGIPIYEPYVRCRTYADRSAYDRAITECTKLAKLRLEKNDGFAALDAVQWASHSYAELGRFEEARKAYDLLDEATKKKYADLITRDLADLPAD